LLELLAVVACIGILAVLGMGAVNKSLSSASAAKEVNAARNLAAAFTASAVDGEGRYMAGMDMRVNATTNPVYKADGSIVANSRAAQRYPFRIAPYLENRFDGTILVNRNGKQILKGLGGNTANYDYYVSTYPSLGINAYCVGGVVFSNGTTNFDKDCINMSSRMKGSILLFASAGQGTGTSKMDGYCYVTPPTLSSDSPYCVPWSDAAGWNPSKDPAEYGYVDFRYGGKAVCAFLDGSVRMCSVEELNDMRIWSKGALEADDKNYTLSN